MKKLHSFAYTLGRAGVRPLMRLKYSFTTDKLPELDEPFILLSNHTTEDDMLFTICASKTPTYFVCGEHLLRNKQYGKALRLLFDPIPVPKGGASVSAMKEILKRMKDGDNVCMFPEGKRSFHGETIPAPSALGKLVKKTGCALITYRIRGGYFTYPRWSRGHHRKGHAEGRVMGVYSSKQLAGMTASEITDIINRDTYENAYEVQRQKMWKYKGKDKTFGMEHVLFMCPCCGSMDSIWTKGDDFGCMVCGMKGTYNEYGFFESDSLPFDNVHSWMRWTETAFDSFVNGHEGDGPLFVSDDVLLYQMRDNYENEDLTRGGLTVYKDRLVIGEDTGERYEFVLGDIPNLSILFGNILLFTYGGNYCGITGDSFSAWKCGRLWHLIKGDTADRTKEM